MSTNKIYVLMQASRLIIMAIILLIVDSMENDVCSWRYWTVAVLTYILANI